MKELLYIDCCIRGAESRTKQIADSFFTALDQTEYHVSTLNLMEEPIKPLVGEFFEARQRLLEDGNLEDARFHYAHQFADADMVVIAAPFWDLSFPALLKIYIENVSVDGITFGCNEKGIYGKCKGTDLLFLTSRGGFYNESLDEQGSRYLDSLSRFFGFDRYERIAADGLDSDGVDPVAIVSDSCEKAKLYAKKLK